MGYTILGIRKGPFSIYQWGGGDDLKFSVSEKTKPPLKFFTDFRNPPLEKYLSFSHPPLSPKMGMKCNDSFSLYIMFIP